MIDRNSRNRRLGVGVRRRGPRTVGSRDVSGAIAHDVGKVIRGACREFAIVADWQQKPNGVSHHKDGGLDDLIAGYQLSENHVGLHSGMYINVTLLGAANALAIKGGRYDRYGQPQTIHKESVPLREVTAEALSCLLAEMHDRLQSGGRAHVV